MTLNADDLLRGARANPESLKGAALDGVDFSGQDLTGLDLSGASLRGANLRGASLRGTCFVDGDPSVGADLSGADLRGAEVELVELIRVYAFGALDGIRLSDRERETLDDYRKENPMPASLAPKIAEALPRLLGDDLPPHAHEYVDFSELCEMIRETRNGHAFQAGWHFGWNWAGWRRLDFMSEHRMTDMAACEFTEEPDGEISLRPIETPSGFRLSSADAEEDARLDREHVEESQRLYGELRRRRLLPPLGENLGSQDMNEILLTRPDDSGSQRPA